MKMVGLHFGLFIRKIILSSFKRLLLKCRIGNQAYLVSIQQLMEHVYPVLIVKFLNAITLIENVIIVIRLRATLLKENQLTVKNI